MSALQVPTLNNWVIQVDLRLENVSRPMEDALWTSRSIYRLPKLYVNPRRRELYKPQVVSFGPYHHGEPHLKLVEAHKERVFCRFLQRAEKRTSDCVAAVELVVRQLMDSYDQLDEGWKESERFLQLMILDGCFILEIFRNNDPNFSDEYAYNDPIFGKHARLYKLPRMKRDMLMIENQLPLLLLKTLVAFETGSPQNEESINELVMKFFEPHRSTSKLGHRGHVLDVVRQSMLRERIHHQITSTTMLQESIHQDTLTRQSMYPCIFNRSMGKVTSMSLSMCQKIFNPCRSPTPREQGKQEVIWPATQLHEAGIRFKSSKTQNLNDIRFEKGFLCLPGTISLPEIEVDDATESKFLNLMAFEQLHADAGSEVSSYVSFMDNIIDSEKDVILLNEKKIIKNFVGTEKNVADLFNGLAFDVSVDPGCRMGEVGEVHREVIAYCNNYCLRFHQSLADLRQIYFRSPWSCISLFAAIFLLCLTVIQTLYAVLGYYHQQG